LGNIALFAIVKLTKLPIRLNPLSSDNYGGLSILGNKIIELTGLSSFGSLILPLGISVGTSMGRTVFSIVAWGLIIFYSAVILASFVIPVFYLKGVQLRQKKLLLAVLLSVFSKPIPNIVQMEKKKKKKL